MDFSYGNYSENEKAFWLGMERKVDTPFKWGDISSMDFVWDIILIAFFLVFVVAVCIFPVFAAEYESGAAALLLTTRNGKRRLVNAKIIVAALFSVIYTALGIGLGVAAIGLSVGIYGAELPVQLWETTIPYNWSAGRACMVSFVIMLLITLTIALFTAYLSVKTKAGIVTLVLDFAILIAPALLPMSKKSGLWNHINYLFPVRVMKVKDVIKTFNSYQFGSAVLSYLGMAAVVYITVSILCLIGIKSGFTRRRYLR